MIGVIADDFTGATDVAVMFRREGLRTLLYFGLPTSDIAPVPHDVAVIALKSRMSPAEEAVGESLQALQWLQHDGCDAFYFKYCSTFDSTDKGNIGPVLDALSHALGDVPVVTTPSSPEHGRTQYLGYLFVEDKLLSESHMAHHPLTPMTDSSLVRTLSRQTTAHVGLVPHHAVRQGDTAIKQSIDNEIAAGGRYLLIDAVEPDELNAIARVLVDHRLTAGAAGLARGLATAIAQSGAPIIGDHGDLETYKDQLKAPAAIVAGSCSKRTLEQLDVLVRRGHPMYYLDPTVESDPQLLAHNALQWFDGLAKSPDDLVPAIYSSSTPSELQCIQQVFGVLESARIVEHAMSLIAIGLVERGIGRLIAAGGETSGAVVSALHITGGLVGPEMAPGVPWIFVGDRDLAMLLKSGNFGAPEFFLDAIGSSNAEAVAR